MELGKKIKNLRKERGVTQQQIADLINMHRSNYSKIENGQRDISVNALNKIAKFFNVSVDNLINETTGIPKEVTIKDKSLLERVKLIQELEKEEQNLVLKFIDSLLTKQKFKDFFNKNIATL